MTFANIILILFLIMDPIGNITPFLTLVKELEPNRQKWIVFREMLIALAIMVGFNLIGAYILQFLDLSESTVYLASGLILFLIAIRILFPSATNLRSKLPSGEPFIFPLAVPLIAGPGVLATIMLYSDGVHFEGMMLAAIAIAWLAAVVILYFADPIKRVLGNNGLIASERLIGMVLVLLSVQRILEGIIVFWSEQSKF